MVEGNLKKLTIVGPLPPPAGGMANQTRKLKELVESEGLEVNIVQTNSPYKPAFVSKIPILRALFRLIAYWFALNRAFKETEIVHIMSNSGWSWYLFTVPAVWVAKRHQLPVVINYRGGYARDFFKKSWQKIRKTVHKADLVIVPSPFLQEVFSDYQVTTHIVPNVLDTALFHADNNSPTSIDEQPQQLQLAVTRNLEKIYDNATAIKAFAQVVDQYPQAQLKVAGTGPEFAKLENLVKSLNIENRVTFTGRLSPQEIANLYRESDIILNASTVDNTPNSLIEAMACGVPIVTTDVGGIPKLCQHNVDALFFPAGDESAMAQAIVKLISDQPLRQKLISNGIKTTAKFHWHSVWRKLQANYQQALTINSNNCSNTKSTNKLESR